MKKRYKIAGTVIVVTAEEDNDVWAKMEWNYSPFEIAVDSNGINTAITIELRDGISDITPDCQLIFKDIPKRPDMPELIVYRDPRGNLYFKTVQPHDTRERVVLMVSPELEYATVYIEHMGEQPRPWQVYASLTSAIQLAYHLAAQNAGNLLSHASCVIREGKAYLFLGKSGTGKSTHSRMWREAFPDTVLLNDDHPIVRVEEDGQVMAYGSPWSGKTPCYKNLSAPIGGIVRICRGDTNSIKQLSTLEAFASLSPSIFGIPYERRLSDVRHKYLERVIASVPCYELHCLPTTDAARVCHKGVTSKS